MVKTYIAKQNPVVIALNFISEEFPIDYIFSSNMRRYHRLENISGVKKIITSNIKEAKKYDYMVNYASYISAQPDIVDNSGLMLLKLLLEIGHKSVAIAGMDGYVQQTNYFDQMLNADFVDAEKRNHLIADEICELQKKMQLEFITPTSYID